MMTREGPRRVRGRRPRADERRHTGVVVMNNPPRPRANPHRTGAGPDRRRSFRHRSPGGRCQETTRSGARTSSRTVKIQSSSGRFLADREAPGSTTHIRGVDREGWACSVHAPTALASGVIFRDGETSTTCSVSRTSPPRFFTLPARPRKASMMAPTIVAATDGPELAVGSGGVLQPNPLGDSQTFSPIDEGMQPGCGDARGALRGGVIYNRAGHSTPPSFKTRRGSGRSVSATCSSVGARRWPGGRAGATSRRLFDPRRGGERDRSARPP